MQQTSIEAFLTVKPRLTDRQGQVLDVIEANPPMDNKAIAAKLGWQINQVTGRVLELRLKGLVVRDRIDVNQEGRSINVWRARREDDEPAVVETPLAEGAL